ncbi:hypothetical protein MLD52_09040 [Puniceicoccaceae bacterium K14]|nr:hypothetical protein [Puniceicoccaceae bacterium K14]
MKKTKKQQLRGKAHTFKSKLDKRLEEERMELAGQRLRAIGLVVPPAHKDLTPKYN